MNLTWSNYWPKLDQNLPKPKSAAWTVHVNSKLILAITWATKLQMEWFKKRNSTRQNKEQLSCLPFPQIPTVKITNGTVKMKHQIWKFCSISIKLRNGIGNQYQQVLNTKCGMFGVLKSIRLFSIQKSTFLLTNEVNSDTKTKNWQFCQNDLSFEKVTKTNKFWIQNVVCWEY